jgi:hypothetical protein
MHGAYHLVDCWQPDGSPGIGLDGLWMGQGSGYFPYPAESFMINQTLWIYWGLLLAIIGLAAVVISRKRGR